MPRRCPIAAEVDVATLRVAKTIRSGQHGAKRHASTHGADLVCVRHRIDPRSNTRYVTVELVVEVLPVASRDNQEVAVRLAPTQRTTRALLLSCGAVWDQQQRVWRMSRSVARTLRVLHQVVPNPG